jgi:outer membrane immunogenic protein
MKKYLLAIGVLAAGALPASAADLAARPYTKAPPPVVAAIYDWSGFYLGINGGGGWNRSCWDIAGFDEGCHTASGGTVGGQLGYRWQTGAWVFGLEGQGNWADISGSNPNVGILGLEDHSKLEAFGLFTGQVGYAFDNILGYVKGGAAVVGDRYDTFTTGTNVMLDRANTTRWGGTIGAGIEYGFAPNWSVGVEYDHIFLGNKNLNFVAAAGQPGTGDREHDTTEHHQESEHGQDRETSDHRGLECHPGHQHGQPDDEQTGTLESPARRRRPQRAAPNTRGELRVLGIESALDLIEHALLMIGEWHSSLLADTAGHFWR